MDYGFTKTLNSSLDLKQKKELINMEMEKLFVLFKKEISVTDLLLYKILEKLEDDN